METRTLSYFHDMTLIRRRKNTYESLQREDGTWVTNQVELEDLVTTFYKNLFMEEVEYKPFCLHGAFPSFPFDSREELANMVSLEEYLIWVPLKPLVLMVFVTPSTPILNNSQWRVVRNSLAKLVVGIFAYPSKVEEINDTLISLIPNINRVYNMKNFKPISLCNVPYKIGTKTFAQRSRHVDKGQIISLLHKKCFIPCRKNGKWVEWSYAFKRDSIGRSSFNLPICPMIEIVENKIWHPIQLSEGGLQLSHLAIISEVEPIKTIL
ncbi:hypothetical protein CR513_03319, partial [Mucuna pruriens]